MQSALVSALSGLGQDVIVHSSTRSVLLLASCISVWMAWNYSFTWHSPLVTFLVPLGVTPASAGHLLQSVVAIPELGLPTNTSTRRAAGSYTPCQFALPSDAPSLCVIVASSRAVTMKLIASRPVVPILCGNPRFIRSEVLPWISSPSVLHFLAGTLKLCQS